MQVARPLDLAQTPAQADDALAYAPAVDLELRLTGSTRPDAAAETREVRPGAREARQHVLELRQLDLELALQAARPTGEDVEDQLAPVEHLDVQLLRQVALLRRAQVLVDEDDAGMRGGDLVFQLGDLARADVRRRRDAADGLADGRDRLDAGRARETVELAQRLLGADPRLRVTARGVRDTDEDRALGLRADALRSAFHRSPLRRRITQSWWHRRQRTERARVAGLEQIDQHRERPHTGTVVIAVEIGGIEEDAADSSGARANDVDVEQVADVHRPRRARAGALERDAEDPGIGLLAADLRRVDDHVEPAREPDARERRAQAAVGVRDDDEAETARAEALERRHHLGRDLLPEVLAGVVVVHLDEGRVRRRGRRHAGAQQDEIEVAGDARGVRRLVDLVGDVELALRNRLRARERRRVDDDAVARERVADPRPARVHEDAAGVEEERVETQVILRYSRGTQSRDERDTRAWVELRARRGARKPGAQA